MPKSVPVPETCHICKKPKGQPPDRCNGHYAGTGDPWVPEPTEPRPEPLTLDNALDVLRSWSWLYDGLRRSEPVDAEATDRHAAEGAEKGRLRQCSIGWHEECSDRSGGNHRGECACPCHAVSMEGVGLFMRWMDECLTHLQENSDV